MFFEGLFVFSKDMVLASETILVYHVCICLFSTLYISTSLYVSALICPQKELGLVCKGDCQLFAAHTYDVRSIDGSQGVIKNAFLYEMFSVVINTRVLPCNNK